MAGRSRACARVRRGKNGLVISNAGNSTKDITDDTARELKKLAAHLRAHLQLIPGYPPLARILGLPCQANIVEEAKNLIGLSNGIHSDPQQTGPKGRLAGRKR
jgi:hypothetical protein